MPVIGHAFVGLGTAMCCRPGGGSVGVSGRGGAIQTVDRPGSVRAADRTGVVRVADRLGLWTPCLVGLAYLPDIAGELSRACGWAEGRVVTHSVLAAVLVSPVVGWCLSRLFAIGPGGAFAVSLVSILLHDGLDVLQATDRRPWWPVSDRPVGLGVDLLPANSLQELLLFGGLLALLVGCRWLIGWARRRRASRLPTGEVVHSPGEDRGTGGGVGQRGVWLGWVLSAGILLSASVTHYLRGVRERRQEEVRALLERGDFPAALHVIDAARRWPSTAKPGRLDYAEAECFVGIGDRRRAEACYLRSLRQEPSYFWAVADLATLYASGDEPVAQRRRRVAPWARRLRTEFSGHAELERVLAKIAAALGDGN